MHFCGGANHSAEGYFKRIRKEKGNTRDAGDSENRQTQCTPHKHFRCGYEYHLIAKCPNPSKENENWQK